jgi:hypothetical protein
MLDGIETLKVSANGTFAFHSPLAAQASYQVIISAQPTGENCLLSGAHGLMPAGPYSGVTLSCSTLQGWAVMSGSTQVGGLSVEGSTGAGATTNTPGARRGSVSWEDGQGNLWLFGGAGTDTSGTWNTTNELWEYTPSTQQWRLAAGSSSPNAAAVWGSKGVASAGAVPGAREGAVGWFNYPDGTFWLFGGDTVDASGNPNHALTDSWRFTPSTGTWEWMGGSDRVDAAGTYGTMGTGSAANLPGSRTHAVGWVDSAGTFYLLGGQGLDANQVQGQLSDLWSYSPLSGQWTWLNGAASANTAGTYPPQGTALPAGAAGPGGRSGAIGWYDGTDAWIYGGYGLDGQGTLGELGDLWKFDPVALQWGLIRQCQWNMERRRRQSEWPIGGGCLVGPSRTVLPAGRVWG